MNKPSDENIFNPPYYSVGDVVFICQKDTTYPFIISGRIESTITHKSSSVRYYVRVGQDNTSRGFDKDEIFPTFTLAKIEIEKYLATCSDISNKII